MAEKKEERRSGVEFEREAPGDQAAVIITSLSRAASCIGTIFFSTTD